MLVDSKDVLNGSEFITLASRSNARQRKSKKWSRACIYVWFRGEQCLYIGCSYRGLNRLFDTNHRTKWIGVRPNDIFKFEFFNGKLPPSTIRRIEEALIKRYKPILNFI